MNSAIIWGGNSLGGEVSVPGDKVTSVHLLCAASIAIASGAKRVDLANLPQCGDVKGMVARINETGLAAMTWSEGKLLSGETYGFNNDIRALARFRSSICLVGPLSLAYGRLLFSSPGGCDFTKRPIDRHVALLHALGVELTPYDGDLVAESRRLIRDLEFDCSTAFGPSVGVTCHALLSAFWLEGTVTLTNAALDPAVSAICDFLTQSTGRRLCVSERTVFLSKPMRKPNAVDMWIPPDHTAAFTYVAAVLSTGGELSITNFRGFSPPIDDLLGAMGVTTASHPTGLSYSARGIEHHGIIELAPWPGISSDIGPILAAALAPAKGRTKILDTVYPWRSSHVSGLTAMGYDISADGQEVVVVGSKPSKVPVTARLPDIRAGAALVIGALARPAQTWLTNLAQVERGYDGFFCQLRRLGAAIEICSTEGTLAQGSSQGVSQ